MPKAGDVQYIDDVKHVMGEDGKWAPEDINDKVQKSMIGAGKSLYRFFVPEQSAAKAEEKPEGYINKKIGRPW